MRVPSGLNAAVTTRSPCPASFASGAPLAASHSRAVLSSEAVTTLVPSGLKDASLTASSWRKGGAVGVPVAGSQIWAVLSCEVDLSTFFFLCRIWASHWVALSAANPPAKTKIVRNCQGFVRKAECKLSPLPKYGLAESSPRQTRAHSGLG